MGAGVEVGAGVGVGLRLGLEVGAAAEGAVVAVAAVAALVVSVSIGTPAPPPPPAPAPPVGSVSIAAAPAPTAPARKPPAPTAPAPPALAPPAVTIAGGTPFAAGTPCTPLMRFIGAGMDWCGSGSGNSVGFAVAAVVAVRVGGRVCCGPDQSALWLASAFSFLACLALASCRGGVGTMSERVTGLKRAGSVLSLSAH